MDTRELIFLLIPIILNSIFNGGIIWIIQLKINKRIDKVEAYKQLREEIFIKYIENIEAIMKTNEEFKYMFSNLTLISIAHP